MLYPMPGKIMEIFLIRMILSFHKWFKNIFNPTVSFYHIIQKYGIEDVVKFLYIFVVISLKSLLNSLLLL